jgi:hypothetical protein
LARRARAKIHEDDARVAGTVDVAQHRRVADRFIEACSLGDLATLLSVLDPEVWGEADLGPHDRRAGVRSGARPVARNLLHWFRPTIALVCNPISDHSEILAFKDRQLYAVLQFTVADELIKGIHVVVDPARLEVIETQLSAR